MNENDVAAISEQFGINKEIVEASVKDGTLSQRIKDSLADKVIYKKDDFETLKKNLTTESETKYFNDLVEKATKGDLPQDLYKPIKGAAYQQLERELSKKYEVSEFKDVFDLVDKVSNKKPASGNEELLKQIEDLKQANIRLNDEKENAVKTVSEQYKNQIISDKTADLLASIPFDFTDVKPDELESRKGKTQTIVKSVFDANYVLDFDEKNRLIVKDKEGNVKQNTTTLEPLAAKDVFIELAKEYNIKLKSPDNGGQGGKSSKENNVAFHDYDSFEAWCKTQNMQPTSAEAVKAWKASGLTR